MIKNKKIQDTTIDEVLNKHELIFVEDERLRIARKYAQESVSDTMKAVREKLKKELDK